MSQEMRIEKSFCFCDKMQKRVGLEVTIISVLQGTPKVEVYRNVQSVKCSDQDENCAEWCEVEEHAKQAHRQGR